MNISKNLKYKIFSKENMVSIAVILSVFIFDRITKIAIIKHQLKIYFFELKKYFRDLRMGSSRLQNLLDTSRVEDMCADGH